MGDMTMSKALELYSGKRVLITGHTGFKGTWLTFLMQELGAEVLGYALQPEIENSHFKALDLEKRITHVVGDIRDSSTLLSVFNDFKPEIVFHLAAQAIVKESYENPSTTFDTNVMGSVSLLDAVRLSDSVRSLVYITSDKCYENVDWVWGYRETDQLGGFDPYSASKAAAELVFSAYQRSYLLACSKLGAASARAGNVIGGGDMSADRIIPDCIKAIESDRPIKLRNPKATRPWQHVLEPISGYILLAANLYNKPSEYSSAWNFGPSSLDVRTVKEVASSIVAYFGKGSVEVEQSVNQLHEARLLQLNCDKANQLLGWQPRWSVDKTITETASWYKSVGNGDDVEGVTRGQLQDYFPELL